MLVVCVFFFDCVCFCRSYKQSSLLTLRFLAACHQIWCNVEVNPISKAAGLHLGWPKPFAREAWMHSAWKETITQWSSVESFTICDCWHHDIKFAVYHAARLTAAPLRDDARNYTRQHNFRPWCRGWWKNSKAFETNNAKSCPEIKEAKAARFSIMNYLKKGCFSSDPQAWGACSKPGSTSCCLRSVCHSPTLMKRTR